MKFTYEKEQPKVLGQAVGEPKTIHRIKLEGSDFQIIASEKGFKLYGETQWFQPESGEVHLPVDDFREFLNRLASAADLAWKEQERARKNALGRRAIMEAK